MSPTIGPRVCDRWVRWYTRSCPGQIAADRKAEIESDLWEHTTDAAECGVSRLALDVDVMRRVLSGVPADLSWRRETLRAHARADSQGESLMSRPRQIASAAVTVLGSIGVMLALSLLPLLGAADSGSATSREVAWVATVLVLGAVLFAGMILRFREQSPRLATTLMAIGSPVPAMAWFWLPPLYVMSAVLLILVFVTHRREPTVAI